MQSLVLVYTFFWDGIKWFLKHDCLMRGAAISFFSFFSIVPILFILTALAGYLLGSDDVLFKKVMTVITERFPYISDTIVEIVLGLIQGWSKMGLLGIFALLLGAERVLHALEESLYVVFEEGRERSRKYLVRRLAGVGVLFIGLIVILASIGITALSSVMIGLADGDYGTVGRTYEAFTGFMFRFVLPFSLVVFGAALSYKITGGSGVRLTSALVGAVVFTILWEVAKFFFASFIANMPYYNKFFGALGALMLLLLWVYYSSCIFLFGASLAASHTGLRQKALE